VERSTAHILKKTFMFYRVPDGRYIENKKCRETFAMSGVRFHP